MSIGNVDGITKEEALKHVQNNDEIGKTIIRINRKYFNMLRSGNIYETIN